MPSRSAFTTLIAVAIVMMLFGLMCTGGGVMLFLEGQTTKAEPQNLTLQQLVESGYGDNAHVLLSEFEFYESYIVDEKQISGYWEKVWFPLVFPDGAADQPLRVVLATEEVHGESSAAEFIKQQQIQGVIGMFSSLSSEERELLEADFPETDFDNVYVIRHVELGSTQPPAAAALCCMAPGVILLLGGVVVIILGARLSRR